MKYPIYVWDQLELTNNDLKYNLNTAKAKLTFFLKSAVSILQAISMSSAGYSYPYNPSGGLDGASSTYQGSSQMPKKEAPDPYSSNILIGKAITLDRVFQRMVKVNNLERNEFDKLMSNNPYAGYSSNNIFTNNN